MDTAAGMQAECFHMSQDLMRMKIIAEQVSFKQNPISARSLKFHRNSLRAHNHHWPATKEVLNSEQTRSQAGTAQEAQATNPHCHMATAKAAWLARGPQATGRGWAICSVL